MSIIVVGSDLIISFAAPGEWKDEIPNLLGDEYKREFERRRQLKEVRDTIAVSHPEHSSRGAVVLSQLCPTCRAFFDRGDEIRRRWNDPTLTTLDKELDSPGPFQYYTEAAAWIASANEGCVICARFLENAQNQMLTEGKSGHRLQMSPKGLDVSFVMESVACFNGDSNDTQYFFLSIYLREALNDEGYSRVDVVLRVSPPSFGKLSIQGLQTGTADNLLLTCSVSSRLNVLHWI
jgi:hypothetical protein